MPHVIADPIAFPVSRDENNCKYVFFVLFLGFQVKKEKQKQQKP